MMRLFAFDTRDKKPKLYHLLIQTVLMAAVAGLLILADPAGCAGKVCLAVAGYCWLTVNAGYRFLLKLKSFILTIRISIVGLAFKTVV